jgi:hypothetical protein
MQSLPGIFLLCLILVSTASAQVAVTFQAGVHPDRLDQPKRTLTQPGRGIALIGAPGEATTYSIRVGTGIGGRWDLEGGLAWSLNRSASGSFGAGVPDFETHTVFSSATVRTLLTRPEAPLGLAVGVGPALVFHRGSGTSLLSRQTDIGAVFGLSGTLALDSHLAIRVDAQQYLFSSAFTDTYTPPLIGTPVQPAGSRFRRELVLLAGLTWRDF